MARISNTRTRILDIAQSAVLAKGFDATSIEEIVAEAEISKGGFFYHFPDKNALAQALIERYIDEEDSLFDNLFGRARELSDDPLQVFLIGLKLLAELLEDIPGGHPGCLVATAAYQDRLFDAGVRQRNKDGATAWRARFKGHLEEIVEQYPPRDAVDLDDLADMVTGVSEGGIILNKIFGDPTHVVRQIMLFRSYIKLLFSPGAN